MIVNKNLKYQGGFLLLSLALQSCGAQKSDSQSTSNKMLAPVELRTDVSRTINIQLTGPGNVTSSAALGFDTGDETYVFRSKLSTNNMSETDFAKFSDNITTTFEFTSPSGKSLVKETIEGPIGQWKVLPVEGEGKYAVSIKVEFKRPIKTFALPPELKTSLTFDTDAPDMVASGYIEGTTDLKRNVNLSVVISNERPGKISCDKAIISYAEGQGTDEIVLTPEILGTPKEGMPTKISFNAKDFSLPATKSRGAVAKISCRDNAGHITEQNLPLRSGKAKFAFNAALEGPSGGKQGPDPMAPDKMIAHSKSGNLKIISKLIDPKTSMPVSSEFAEFEKDLLQVYVSEFLPKTIDDLRGANTLLTAQFKSELSIALPATFLGRKTVHVSFSARDRESGVESLVSVQSFGLYVDNDAGTATWAVGPQFNAPIKGQSITLPFKMTQAGSQLIGDGQPILEFSVDNIKWESVSDVNIKAITGNPLFDKSLSFTYPFESEKPFRVRVRLQDYAGNIFLSKVSPQLLGTAGFNSGSAFSPLPSCTNGTGMPASKLAVALTSRVSCRKQLPDGSALGGAYIPFVFANVGAAPFSFFSTTTEPEKLGYWTSVDKVVLPSSKRSIQPVSFLKELNPLGGTPVVGASNTAGFNLEVDEKWFKSTHLSIEWGKEPQEASSFKNNSSCDVLGNFPTTIITDESKSGFVLQEGAFACD